MHSKKNGYKQMFPISLPVIYREMNFGLIEKMRIFDSGKDV